MADLEKKVWGIHAIVDNPRSCAVQRDKTDVQPFFLPLSEKVKV